MMERLLVLPLLASLASSIPLSPAFNFDLLHLNDIHAHFDPVNARNARCNAEEQTCYGGFPRLYHAIRDIREGSSRSLLLNAGDYYQGTIWYSVFKYKVVAEFSNMLNYTAMSLGNHEFDGGLSGVEPFIQETNFPVLACNVRDKSTGESMFRRSMIDTSLGKRIGIIGYVSKHTPTITNANISRTMEFTDEIQCIREEARILKSQGVNIIIALGHSGYEKDLEIAEEVSEVDIVVGGHSHTFLYPKGQRPQLREWIKGEYPTYVTQTSGRVVPVVQAFCFSKYMGHVELSFDEEGELLQPVKGAGVSLAKVILLDGEEDPLAKEVMLPYQKQMVEYYEVVGQTSVDLTRSSTSESPLGNMVTDSMIHAVNRSSIAFINSGGLRANLFKGSITLEDIIAVLPFYNSIDLVRVTGKSLRLILENVAAAWEKDVYTTFFQVSSGIQLEFCLTEENMYQRLKSARVFVGGVWRDLQNDEEYDILVPNFLFNGGIEGPNFDNQALYKEPNLAMDRDALLSYIKDYSPLQTRLSERIVIKGTTDFVTDRSQDV